MGNVDEIKINKQIEDQKNPNKQHNTNQWVVYGFLFVLWGGLVFVLLVLGFGMLGGFLLFV